MSADTSAKTNVAVLGEKREIVSESLYTKALRRIRGDYLTLSALGVLALLVTLSFSAPLFEQLLGVSHTRTNVSIAFTPPFTLAQNVLGTDDLGRDHFTRLLYAGQISLSIGFFAAILSLTIGVTLGVITGYYGGIVDDAVMWVITTITSIPSLFLLIIVAAVLSPGPTTLILVLGLLGWTGTTRLVRGETFSLREREFVVSARAMGASDVRIMFNHILPNSISLIIVTLALDIGGLLLAEAGLSFLGLGVQPPVPTWGNMLTNAQTFFNKGPYLVIGPGLLITITVLCLYVIGDGVRDAFDPTVND